MGACVREVFFLEGLWRCESGSLIVDLVDRRSLIVEFVKVPNRGYINQNRSN